LFLSIFIFRVAFTLFPSGTELIHWYKLFPEQATTFQWHFWRISIFFIDLLLLIAITITVHQTESAKRHHIYKMVKVLLWIQGWYILEYLTHYTSVWISYNDLMRWGINLGYDDKYSGLSSHVITMTIFAYKCHD